MKKVLVISGPNLNFLGIREPDIYGKKTYADLVEFTRAALTECGFESEFYQSNHEGDIVDKIQDAYGKIDGIIINPAAYTHTSVAILDALKAVAIPFVEVHISKVEQREDFRQISFIRPHALKTITGHGFDGYLEAIDALAEAL